MKVVHVLALLAVGAAALVGHDRYQAWTADRAVEQAAQASIRPRPAAPIGEPAWGSAPPVPDAGARHAPAAPAAASTGGRFRCDGRTHCSQMTSCAEAEYFLQHCPNVRMDGNNDGEPCEQQWCN